MKRISEVLRSVSLKGFKKTGTLKDDIERFCEFHESKAEAPEKVGLRLMLGEPMTVYQLTDSVCRKILSVRIENLPDEYPQFLKNPFLIESKPGKYLFDDITTIGGYINDEGIFVIIAYGDINSLVLKEENPFNGIRLDKINFYTNDDNSKAHENKAKNILPFITVLSLMLEAERSPVLIDDGNKKTRKRNRGQSKNSGGADWIEHRIYLDALYSSKNEYTNHAPMDKHGKIKRDVFIQGFLRNQPYGPKHSLRKWIYVEGFESSRWSYDDNRKITLDIKGTQS